MSLCKIFDPHLFIIHVNLLAFRRIMSYISKHIFRSTDIFCFLSLLSLVCWSVCLLVCQSNCWFVCLLVCWLVRLSFCLLVWQSISLLSVDWSFSHFNIPSIGLSVCLSACTKRLFDLFLESALKKGHNSDYLQKIPTGSKMGALLPKIRPKILYTLFS